MRTHIARPPLPWHGPEFRWTLCGHDASRPSILALEFRSSVDDLPTDLRRELCQTCRWRLLNWCRFEEDPLRCLEAWLDSGSSLEAWLGGGSAALRERLRRELRGLGTGMDWRNGRMEEELALHALVDSTATGRDDERDTPTPRFSTPSQAAALGGCVYCLGTGRDWDIIEEEVIVCRVCKGSGEFTFPESDDEAWP